MDVRTKVLQNKDQITVVPAVSVVLSLFLAFFWPLFASTAALLVGMIATFRGGFQVGTEIHGVRAAGEGILDYVAGQHDINPLHERSLRGELEGSKRRTLIFKKFHDCITESNRGPIKERDQEDAHDLNPEMHGRKGGQKQARICSHTMGFERSIFGFRGLNEMEEDKSGKVIVG